MNFNTLLKTIVVFYLLFAATITLPAQINPANVTIARDSFGVPHIFAKTDAEVAYGLAWAHSEDNFKDIQLSMLAPKNMLGSELGKDGVLFDYAMQFLQIDSIVEARYELDLSPQFRGVLDGYVQGLNDYAAAHPKEVLKKKAFPITGKDVIKGYVMNTSLMAGLGMALKAAKDDKITDFFSANDVGSNAVAVDPEHMADGKGYLAINSHQPIEGRFAWYEAHVNSDEGWNMIGGLFPGGMSIFVGSNPNLGWAHTTNYHNFGDIHLLEINPKNKNQYKYDGEWRNFKKDKAKLRIKLAGIVIGVKKKLEWTEYGPVFKTKQGKYSFRFPGYMDIKAAEQWFLMNKASNFKEFETAIKMQSVPLFNIVYADVDGNIMLHSGGRVPERDPKLDWTYPITAATSAYKWDKIVPYDRMPTVLNPSCGYVFNANNTPLKATGDTCDWTGEFVGLQRFMYNRGDQFDRLLKEAPKPLTVVKLNEIKFNTSYAPNGTYMSHFKAMYTLDGSKYPDITDAIQKLKNWNLAGDADNKDAALALIIHDKLSKKHDVPFAFLMIQQKLVSEEDAVWAIREAKKFLLKTHGTLDVPLGMVQRHIRGEVSLPASGLREVPRAADAVLFDKKKGIYRLNGGDGYIQIVRYSKDKGAEILSVNAYGASDHPDSPHYTDQMELFNNQQFKPMTFDKTTILKNALKVYTPGQIDWNTMR
jgi:acyl-homoserine-lactone acylase